MLMSSASSNIEYNINYSDYNLFYIHNALATDRVMHVCNLFVGIH